MFFDPKTNLTENGSIHFFNHGLVLSSLLILKNRYIDILNWNEKFDWLRQFSNPVPFDNRSYENWTFTG